ncbi:MAG: SYNERG-CTERM sorting domain-containing protein [Synergistaceae bacterium]|nr:SYNERG-CTERM sorting domain-containing protein [Synergistaceae bacterium]
MKRGFVFMLAIMLAIGASSFAWANVLINEEHFPDAAFREHVKQYDTNGDNVLSDTELASVINMEISIGDRAIIALIGIEYFTALETLDCSFHSITAINLSKNTALKSVLCNYNKIAALYIGDNLNLETLVCMENELADLDVSGCPALKSLWCSSNQIEELNLSNNRNLRTLYCNGNQIRELDVSKNPYLAELFCDGNQLTELDVSKNSRLTRFGCTGNRITTLDVSNNPALEQLDCYGMGLTVLDISNNTALNMLRCYNNRLTELNVSKHTALDRLICYNNQLTVLDISNNKLLEQLHCDKNQLTELDVSSNSLLQSLGCGENRLTAIDVSNNPNLSYLNCESNDLTELNVTNNPKLDSLYCANNQLRELDVNNNTAITFLICDNNLLTALDISNNADLYLLHCRSNDLVELNVSNNPKLSRLFCYTNRLKTLDVSRNPNLYELFCSQNNLTKIDVSKNPKLYQFSCAHNHIDALDVSSNPNLYQLYCHDNRIKHLDLSNNEKLVRFSCTNNMLGELDLSNNPNLRELDCGGNYLATLDVSNNPNLRELYFSGTTLRSVDLSLNTQLISLDCISTDITTIDLSSNSSLDAVGCYGNSRLESLYISSTDNPAYPYKTDLREYTGSSYTRITALKAYGPKDTPITVSFSQGQPEALFAQLPNYIIYDYSTGYTGSASASDVPRTMSVKMSVPTLNFTYLPKIESKVVSVDSKVVSIDEAVNFSASSPITIEQQDEDPEPELQTEDDASDSLESIGSSGGGCASGFGLWAVSAVIAFALLKKKSGLAAILLVCVAASCSWANVDASDYTLPIPHEIYSISGTCTSDFTLTSELRDTIAGIAGVSSDKVRSFSEIAVSPSWNVLPMDLYNLSRSGEYGGAILPLISNAASTDRYVILCTLSNDIQPGEQLSVHGFEVDTSTRESVYDENKTYLATFIILDENLNRVEKVPQSRKIYVAVSLRPEYVNAGIVTVVRGRYVEEENPLYRMDPGAAQRIADDLGIRLDELKYLSRANIGRPVPPTEAMRQYVSDDNHEIVINLPTVSVDEKGMYMIPITLSDDEFELVKGMSVSDYKTYALHDSELGDGQMRPAFINGLLGTWEIYSLTGEKLESFGVKEFLLVGILDAGNPFSLYLGKLLLALLMGGCNSGFFAGGIVLIVAILALRR